MKKETYVSNSQIGDRVEKPWGYYRVLGRGDGFLVKQIVIYPREQISLQLHNHRSEHWVVVKGQAKAIKGNQNFTISENQSFYISKGEKHRIHNPADVELWLIEVQYGAQLVESDIVRFEDQYGRI